MTLVLGMVLFAPTRAYAQATLPGAAEPGQIEKRFEEAPTPRSEEEEIRIPRTRRDQTPAGADSITFTVKGIIVEGATVYGQKDFLPLYEDILGKEITLARVYEIAQRITDKYLRDGYVLSQAVVPPQRIGGEGIVYIRVVEGHVDTVIIEGEVKGDRSLLDAYAQQIAAARPLNIKTLERYLLLANDLPGADVRSVLRPSEATPGAADLILAVKHDPARGFVNFNNLGNKFIGPDQASLGVTLNSALGFYEQVSARYASTLDFEELHHLNVTYRHPVGTEGTTVAMSGSATFSQPGDTLEPEGIDGRTMRSSFSVAHPFIRSRRENLFGTITFYFLNSLTDQRDARLAEDRIRALRVSATYDFVDTLLGPAVTLFNLELSQGLDILGARNAGDAKLSRSRGRADFTKITLHTLREQNIGSGVSAFIALKAQKSANVLLASEEFAFGGGEFGRSFGPAEILGNDGIAAKFELRYARASELEHLDNYQVFAFFDFGKVWNRDPQGTQRASQSATSAGLGLRANLSERVSIDAIAGKPLNKVVTTRGDEDKDVRGLFSVTVRF